MKLILILSLIAGIFAGCGKPRTAALPVFPDCGQMPSREIICRDTLSPTADDATVARCYAISVEQLLAENETLRARYAPCAKGTPASPTAEPVKKHWWNHG